LSLLLKTIKAFPNGSTLEELFVLLDCSFDDIRKKAIQVELAELIASKNVIKGRDGKWRPIVSPVQAQDNTMLTTNPKKSSALPAKGSSLLAAHADFKSQAMEALEEEVEDDVEPPDPNALLRYWRSALRADPRGAITQVDDRHGATWHLLTGIGPIVPEPQSYRILTIALENLQPEFRQALLRREANENTFAIGWPIAVSRKSGVPCIWPVGLLTAEWNRTATHLEAKIENDDILINPDWLKGAARSTSWSTSGLRDIFASDLAVGLTSQDFIIRLREAVAGHIKGELKGENFLSQLDPGSEGVYDIAGIFLPTDTTFTAGAIRDLDSIAAWPKERLARTSLSSLLSLDYKSDKKISPDINPVIVNREQIQAVRNACSSPISVVTGPPGTGKSQAIVSMAASIIADGGSVLVASKNHQALDAVEDRLGGLATEIPFLVRTLNPNINVDKSIADVLRELIGMPPGLYTEVDEFALHELNELSQNRALVLKDLAEIGRIECEIADLQERIEIREKYKKSPKPSVLTGKKFVKIGLFQRLLKWLMIIFSDRSFRQYSIENTSDQDGLGLPIKSLRSSLTKLRAERAKINQTGDPVKLSEEIVDLTKDLLPKILAKRTNLSEEERVKLANINDDLEFSGSNAVIPSGLTQSVINYRPLWLASVLGTPKRIPLDDGLFDLVIFDEASQCDIASALPLFARAKRAVIVGDNKQLSFIAQIGQSQDRNLMQAQGLPVSRMGRYAQSKRSLFDFALRIKDVPKVLLRQQYRSAGPIVDYISTEFYAGKLATAYDPKGLKLPKSQKPGIAWEDVPGPLAAENGNINNKESAAIAQHVVKLLVEDGYKGSVGIISPFRAQVHEIEKKIRSSISQDKWEAAELRVATVDGFQGQERDIIIFSPCLTSTSAPTAVTFVQRDLRRLNVAISRARAVAHIFGDLKFARSNKVRALARLAAVATEPAHRTGEGTFDSHWERRMFHALESRNLDAKPQHEIAGRRLDFALFGKNGVKLDLEVDGRRWHQDADGNRKLSDHWRDHQLKSMGWKVRRFWVDELAKDMEGCLDLIEQDLS
jgi:very-short-patch-repair endonuclease